MPHASPDCGPGEPFIACDVGNFVPPWDMSTGFRDTAEASTSPTVTEVDADHRRRVVLG